MEIKLGKGFCLTDERAESSYGGAVLVDATGEAYGPNDLVPVASVFCKARFLVDFLTQDQRFSGHEWRIIQAFTGISADII
jgi:hypothetical protein